MQPITSLTDVLDDGAVVSVERQRRLTELLGEGGPYAARWDVDLTAGLVNGGLPHYTADAGNGTVVDHRRAVTAYAELRGSGLEQAGHEVVLQAGDGRLVVRFDGLGRVASMDARLAKD